MQTFGITHWALNFMPADFNAAAMISSIFVPVLFCVFRPKIALQLREQVFLGACALIHLTSLPQTSQFVTGIDQFQPFALVPRRCL